MVLQLDIITSKKKPTPNSTYKKLAVQCHADTFVVNGNLVLRNYIRAESRQLLVAAERQVVKTTILRVSEAL